MKHQFLYLLFIFCFVTVATLLAQTDNKLRTENSLNDMLPGGGTAEDPYLISDYQSLKKVKNNLSAYYLVTMDIDASASKLENGGMGFEPIGSCNVPFKGHFKGNGHYIKNLYVNRSGADNVGLFRCLSGATIDALGLIYCTIIGHDSIGSICGSNINSSSINNCYFSGTVSGNSYVGGCVGSNTAIISCCYATGRVFGNGQILGGLAGFNGSKGSINNCYAIVSVNGYYEAGGLVGFSYLSKITNCYTAGKVSGNDTGGLVGYEFGSTITNSYDNFETSCQIDRVVAGESKSTIELKKQSTFTDWDFKMIWVMSSGNSYPGLRSINNAPFAFDDTLYLNGKTPLHSLLDNDFDIETKQTALVMKVTKIWGKGTTDSVTWISFSAENYINKFEYQIGEKLQNGDTLWGNIATVVAIRKALPGKGTADEPYLISDYPGLKAVNFNLSAYYRVTKDIDASSSKKENDGMGFEPIGTIANPFRGHFNGAGHIIKNLYINRQKLEGVGLFGSLSGAVLDGLGLINCTIFGLETVGGLSGKNVNSSCIKNSYVSGNVTGVFEIGVLVGFLYGSSTIASCYSTGTASGESYIGGLIGFSNGPIPITNCYSTASAFADNGVGGLVGCSYGTLITNCYATGKISGKFDKGGLLGEYYKITINSSYFNLETSCQNDTGKGESQLTNELKKQNSFVNWDFNKVWIMREDSTYPGLRLVNNAPFAFRDSLLVRKNIIMKSLLRNDYDIETIQKTLVYKVIKFYGQSGTDSLQWFKFTSKIKVGTLASLTYRIGEVLTVGDTLWGNTAIAVLKKIENERLVVINDSVTTTEDETVKIPVASLLANDDAALKLSSILTSELKHGIASLINDTIIYTPEKDWNGNEIFQYIASDGEFCDTALVVVRVIPVNDAPVITSVAPTTAIRFMKYIYNISAVDAEGSKLSYSLSNAPSGMMITDNVISWIPIIKVHSSGEITLTVSDGELSSIEKFTVTVFDATDNLKENTEYIYPNPAREGFYINVGEKIAKVFLYKQNGTLIFYKQVTGIEYIDIRKLSKGIYIIRISKNDEYKPIDVKLIKI